jgi:uncharacterized protein (DUF885 family)
MNYLIDWTRFLEKNAAVMVLIISLAACDPQATEQSAETISAEQNQVALDTVTKIKINSTTALRNLADDVWASYLQNNTYYRLQEGLSIDKFEDLTLEQYHQDQQARTQFRTRLFELDASMLADDDLITYEILDFHLQDNGANDDDFWLNFDITPYQGPYYFQFALQALAAKKIEDVSGITNYLMLVGEFADMIDHLLIKIEGQVERGIYLPKAAIPSARATWEGLKSVVPVSLQVSDERLSALSEEQKATFHKALNALIANRVSNRFDQLLAAMGSQYLANAPESVGLSQYPGGSEVYKRRIRKETTLSLSPAAIHARGKLAVADIASRMKALRKQLGFEGTASEFIESIRVDPKFIAKTPEEVGERFREYITRIEPNLDTYFKYKPNAEYGIRRLPPASEASITYGYYIPPTTSESIGYYHYNASNLPTRNLIWAGSLIYHELLPGHHFHMATQQENKGLQDFRQNFSVAAFTEGWAEYAASLAIEMGMYENTYELYGRYLAEMFLACRLVVDTGMNSMNWTLAEARAYMREHVIQSEAEIASETLRYSTSIPAQALAYRLGYEKITELRQQAEESLGNHFDIREFHNVVLSDGTKPLPVLEAKINRYILSKKKGAQ